MARLLADVPDELHKRVSDFAHEKEIDIKQVIIPAMEEYLGGPRTEPHLLSRYAKEFDLLFAILEYGEKTDKLLMRDILKRFTEHLNRPKK